MLMNEFTLAKDGFEKQRKERKTWWDVVRENRKRAKNTQKHFRNVRGVTLPTSAVTRPTTANTRP